MENCKHEKYTIEAQVVRVLETGEDPEAPLSVGFLQITVKCEACVQPFEFICPESGTMSRQYPTRSIEGLGLCAPFRAQATPEPVIFDVKPSVAGGH